MGSRIERGSKEKVASFGEKNHATAQTQRHATILAFFLAGKSLL
jgi:hypothetical protein